MPVSARWKSCATTATSYRPPWCIGQQGGQNDAAEAQACTHAECLCCLDLADGDRQDRATQHFRHIGALHETEYGDRDRKAVQLEGRQIERGEEPIEAIHARIIKADDQDQLRNGADGSRVEFEQ